MHFVVFLGLILSAGNAWFAGFAICAFWLYYERIMLAEEAYLERVHGDRYRAWAARTPAFLPRVTGWHPPELAFSLRAALRRELHSLFQAVAVFALLAGSEAALVRSMLPLQWIDAEPLWARMFIASLLFYLGARLVKKKTEWLQVEGR